MESQAALAQAFSPPPSRSCQLVLTDSLTWQPTTVNIETETSSGTKKRDKSSTSVEESPSSGSSDDSQKAEYEAQVEIWRAQSSEAREKAEKERKRWEELRALEREEAARRNAGLLVVKEDHEVGWETVSDSKKTESTVVSPLRSPSPTASRDLLPGESGRQVRRSPYRHWPC